MGGVRERRQRQQDAIDRGEPLRTKKGKIKKGNEKGFRPNSGRHIGERVGTVSYTHLTLPTKRIV